jgi:hypothetical protein
MPGAQPEYRSGAPYPTLDDTVCSRGEPVVILGAFAGGGTVYPTVQKLKKGAPIFKYTLARPGRETSN